MGKRTASTKGTSVRQFVRSLVEAAREQEAQLGRASRRLREAQASLAAELHREVSREETADVVAQAVACAGPMVQMAAGQWSAVKEWLHGQATDWERWVLEVLSTEYSVPGVRFPLPLSSPSPAAHLYDLFLYQHAPKARKRSGVFFTPEPIVKYIVAQVDQVLREEFELDDGLASSSTIIFDPAAGTGVFLLAAIERIHHTMRERWHTEGCNECEIETRWNRYVPRMLDLLWGIEILPAAAFLTKLNIALRLDETGYKFAERGRINVVLGDALIPSLQSVICNLKSGIPVVIGNPPFSSLSTNTNPWISRLVRGDEEVRGYVRANGQQLGERKTWLHDDYVKFIRLAQWHVEQAGCGIVGYVTNHGYLDNATFRLMRQELMRVFPSMRIVDLHGNRKKHETAPDGRRDENVFGLDQGVAIGLFCRPPSSSVGLVEYAELWGSRESKLQSLAQVEVGDSSLALRASVVVPQLPEWRLVPCNGTRCSVYDSAWSLADAMPIHASAPVTARDQFVVAFTEEELRQRIWEFRDLSILDDDIRQRYFQRTRSDRYPPGDTRGWKLAEARRRVAADDDWERHIVRCLYRPFDWRFVFWHPAMIDWPRREVTRHLVEGSRFGFQGSGQGGQRPEVRGQEAQCLCLIARRQQLPTQACTFFWVADGLAIDGVIRSDNRGSESLFPLYVRDAGDEGNANWRANFAHEFIAKVSRQLGLDWTPVGRADLAKTYGPEDLLAYVYALFHAPSYRERNAEALRGDFPRVVVPHEKGLFAELSQFGREQITLHLLRDARLLTGAGNDQVPSTEYSVPSGISAFRVGGYVALRKWLQPKHRSIRDPEYHRIAAAIGRTKDTMNGIDEAIARAGGWPGAFFRD